MEIRAAYPAPLHCNECFMILWDWLWNVDNTYVSCSVKLCCFHFYFSLCEIKPKLSFDKVVMAIVKTVTKIGLLCI